MFSSKQKQGECEMTVNGRRTERNSPELVDWGCGVECVMHVTIKEEIEIVQLQLPVPGREGMALGMGRVV